MKRTILACLILAMLYGAGAASAQEPEKTTSDTIYICLAFPGAACAEVTFTPAPYLVVDVAYFQARFEEWLNHEH